MKRPGIGKLNRALGHSSLSDDLFRIEYIDIQGENPENITHDFELTQKRNMSLRVIGSYINQEERFLNRKDINVAGYWNS